MTRENKLALVVGFALILVVGILISDHFSAARSEKSARLGQVVDPTRSGALAGSDLIEYDNGLSTPLTNTSTVAQPAGESFIRTGLNAASNLYNDVIRTPPSQRESATVAMNNTNRRVDAAGAQGESWNSGVNDPLVDRSLSGAAELPIPGFYPVDHEGRQIDFVYHHVSPGESLSVISRKYYGDDSMVKQIALTNNITDPNQIKVGLRLRIPSNAPQLIASAHAQRLSAATAERQQPPAPQTPPAAVQTYTVKSGDTLGDIALKTMGTSRKWKKLYEYNTDVLKDPDHVVAGMVLKIPPT